ncbi:MAG TPA: guanylate kinase [Chlamydiales bacterium]|nr:guanylate kinase [Chlamydiales bacterium]
MSKLLGDVKRGLVFIVSAPAGTGKTTLVHMLTHEFPSVVQSISCTTRPPRPMEKEGVDYYFLAQEEFQKKIASGDFLEYAEVFDHFYGTPKAHVEELRASGKHVILVIDTQGAMQLKNKIDAVHIFISPPDFHELEKRLEGRESDSEQEIQTRLSWAHDEMEAAKQYDYVVVNDTLETAYQVLRSILIAEEHRVRGNR